MDKYARLDCSSKFNTCQVGRGSMDSFVRFENVTKEYRAGDVVVTALQGVSFEIMKGEICIILGESGAGKTTVLNILGGMDTLTSGKAYLGEKEISLLNKKTVSW
jgi:putative ABC transport system ATP-binding protein